MIDVDFKSFVLGRSAGTVLVSGEPSEKKFGKTLDFVPTGLTGRLNNVKKNITFGLQWLPLVSWNLEMLPYLKHK